ncbi:DNA starvation/stationary phase protection protein [Paenibacillus favisporus]|uniref:Dps family protein n=1 Tax=Paenibacillus favisporus TaxID=221028 RepID=UPI002DB7F9E3|nr:Dps family protein [Paenibacillus favisporus]MEC0178760.1 DNA starvation/stationary phase protection protein [Paenibacillus favisporus]
MANTTITLEQVLNQQVANFSILYVKIHNYHWYVKGEQFFTLHAKFEELYNDITQKVDDIAERLLTIKGRPAATIKEYLEIGTVAEATGKEDARGMVQSLIHDFSVVSKELQDGIRLAEDVGDHPTADMLIGIQADLDKHVWMLESYLG